MGIMVTVPIMPAIASVMSTVVICAVAMGHRLPTRLVDDLLLGMKRVAGLGRSLIPVVVVIGTVMAIVTHWLQPRRWIMD
jgi:hypothetical protein